MESIELTQAEIEAIRESKRCDACGHLEALHGKDFCRVYRCMCWRGNTPTLSSRFDKTIELVERGEGVATNKWNP